MLTRPERERERERDVFLHVCAVEGVLLACLLGRTV